MSWNGSGTFNRTYSWVADAAAGLNILASRMDTDTNDIASNGFGNCLTRDGQGQATANLPMASFRHTGVGNGAARNDYAAVGQVQDGVSLNWTTAGGTADALTATYTPALTALVDGQLCFVRAANANATTTPTFAPNGLTARTITKYGGAALAAGDIVGNLTEITLRYNLSNTRWELVNPANPAPAISFTTLTSGSGNYATKAGCKRIEIRMVGGGGGGGGTGTSGNTAGGNGGTTTFNAITAVGGAGGATNSSTSGGLGGSPGSGGAGSATVRIAGSSGGCGASVNANYSTPASGAGGCSPFGGAGGPVFASNGANVGATTSGSGGSGGANASSASIGTAGGGASGEYVEFVINSPSGSYAYVVGAAGAAGGAGAGGIAGAAGGSAQIVIKEFFA